MKVRKTTFDQEQLDKQEFFLQLNPMERWEFALMVRELMRKPGVKYSYRGQKVRIAKNAAS